MGKVQVLKTGLSLVRKGANSLSKDKRAPKTLGCICPDGQINFQNEESAVKYIYNRLHESLALPKEQQFERLIAKKNSSILSEVDGSAHEIDPITIRDKLLEGGAEVYHSHPDALGSGKAYPLSLFDIKSFVGCDMKKICAINSKGEFNCLEANEKSNDENLSFLLHLMQSFVGKFLPYKYVEYTQMLISGNLNRCIQIENQALHSTMPIEEYLQFFHEQYKKANNYGMKYSTNFSNLLKYDA